MKFVHLLALVVSYQVYNKILLLFIDSSNISSVHVSNGMGKGGYYIYVQVCKSVLMMLDSVPLTKLLLDSNAEVLTLLIRSLISLSDCDYTAGDLKPYIQFSDLLSLPVCS